MVRWTMDHDPDHNPDRSPGHSPGRSPATCAGPHRTTVHARHDPAPQPPVEPALEDCCGNGCTPCIFDLYQDAHDRYEAALEAWRGRQPPVQAAGPEGGPGSGG